MKLTIITMNKLQKMQTGRILLSLFTAMLTITAQAEVSALTFSPSTIHYGDLVTIVPTIPSVPEGKVYVCWGIYSDADCLNEIDTIAFSNDGLSSNAVSFTAPEEGTYYIQCTLRTGSSCNGLIDASHISSLAVVPDKETPTGTHTTDAGCNIRKHIIDGTLYIVRDGKIYDARGVRIE